MNPKQFRASDFDYDLPEGSIAKYPLEERDKSKLLVYKDDLKEDIYQNIAEYLPQNSLLVFNNSKVIPARIRFKNATGGKIEIFCLEPLEGFADAQSSLGKSGKTEWYCMIGGRKKWKQQFIYCQIEDLTIRAELLGQVEDKFHLAFSWTPAEMSFAKILEKVGEIPIPPYFKRASEELDYTRYQTTFAEKKGSVAAPTAGLHFTENIFKKLAAKQIKTAYTTLYVGAGTFLPVKSDTIGGHTMHSEWIEVSSSLIAKLREQLLAKAPIIPVGTTALRTLESLYWMGLKAKQRPTATLQDLEVRQWEAYELEAHLPPAEALEALLNWFQNQGIENLACKTQILILPTYALKLASALVTNFHQPRSTLLMLIGAFVGEDWKRIYRYAQENEFRFLSYGDGSLLFAR